MAHLGIIGADPSEPPSNEAVITLANHLLEQFNIPTKIHNIEDINAALFVILYESLFSERLPGIIRQPSCKEDEIHNCHVVIDVLSTDVIRDNLSHIRAEDIVTGDITAISNLLDIFSYLLEYVTTGIDQDGVKADTEDAGSVATTEPDLTDVAPPSSKTSGSNKLAKKPIPKQSKVKVSSLASNRTNNNGARTSKKEPSSATDFRNGIKTTGSLDKNENRMVISHEDFYNMSHGGVMADSFLNRPPSPIGADHSTSLLGQKSVDSDFDQDKWEKKSQEVQRPTSPKVAWDDKEDRRLEGLRDEDLVPATESVSAGPAISSVEAAAVPPQASASHGSKAGISSEPLTSSSLQDQCRPVPSFSASMPAPYRTREDDSKDPLRSTVGPISYHSQQSTPEKAKPDSRKDTSVKGFSSSYDDLRHLVEKTAALTRVALETSPVRSRAHRLLDITDTSDDRPRPHLSSEGVKLARELNALGLHPSDREDIEIRGRTNKKVAFVASESDSSYPSRPEHDLYRRPLGSLSNRELYRGTYLRDAGDSLDRELEDGLTETDYRIRMVQNNSADEKAKAKPSKSGSKSQTLAKHLARNCQSELGAARMTLKTEDRALRKKQEILRRMYDEEMDEYAEEVKYMMDKDAKQSEETYDQYIRKCLEGAPKKKTEPTEKKGKSTTIPSKCKKRKVTGAKSGKPTASRSSSGQNLAAASPALLSIQSEDDLLPVLLEAFPHLHLSEHTWHELWRRGLHQIEALTNAYQASQRKKSQAQSQLEDAAQRHELLANIMRKQVEHTKRLRDIKEQKQQQIQVKNKMHEKRMQSARARRYYNEYQVRARGKQLKKRTKEEMVFRELFKDALDIQKERIKDIRQYASDQRKRQQSKRQDEIDSMENFYQNQFEMLAEKLTKERLETEIRDSAQQKMMERLKRELRKKMESEIKLYQEQMFRDDDDAHFRQRDADRIRQQLHLTQYSAKI